MNCRRDLFQIYALLILSLGFQIWRAAVFEGVASMIMVLVGILATISILEAGYSSPVLYIAIFQGLILSLAILAAGPATGGHVNPCISFTEMLTGHISPVRCLLYILAQSLGSIVAAFWVKVSTIVPAIPKFSHSTHFWLAM